MKLPISNRLLACCNYVNQNDRVADVGTDHGYLGIHLLRSGIAAHVIASDISRMPLDSALHNAVKYGVRDAMSFYLSDGLRNVPRDFDVLVCAGMGADTIIHILENAPWLRDGKYRLVLQCQSRRPELRRWLSNAGWCIRQETLARDGKFIYPVLEAVFAPAAPLTNAECYLSPALLASGSPLLPAFYERVTTGLRTSIAGMEQTDRSEKLAEFRAVLAELEKMEEKIYVNRR